MDLAEGHQAALDHLFTSTEQFLTLNLGSGKGHSVLDVIHCFEQTAEQSVPYQFAPRREGDAPICVADPTLAQRILGWQTRRTLMDMCRDGWTWQRNHPRGYDI